jgi:hypothetical protein
MRILEDEMLDSARAGPRTPIPTLSLFAQRLTDLKLLGGYIVGQRPREMARHEAREIDPEVLTS